MTYEQVAVHQINESNMIVVSKQAYNKSCSSNLITGDIHTLL